MKFSGGLGSLGNLAENVRREIEEMEIPAVEGVAHRIAGSNHRTITISAGIRRDDESVEMLMYDVDRLLILKDKHGRNRVYLRD